MTLEKLPYALTVCKPAGLASVPLESEFFFLARTDEELSLVCRTEDAPEDAVELARTLAAGGMAKKEAIREAARRTGLSRRDVYQAALAAEGK